MAENELAYESQHERWLKYGGNVVLTVIVAVVLAVVVVALAQRTDRRFDTTAAGAYSLKPQTVNIIKNIKTPVKLVSLYSKPTAPAAQKSQEIDYGQTVADLLHEYQRKGKNID